MTRKSVALRPRLQVEPGPFMGHDTFDDDAAIEHGRWFRQGDEVLDGEGRLIAVVPRSVDPKTLRTVVAAPRLLRALKWATEVLHDARASGEVDHIRGLREVTEELRRALDEINGHLFLVLAAALPFVDQIADALG